MKQKALVVYICVLSILLMACQKEAEQSSTESQVQTKTQEETTEDTEQQIFQPNEEAFLMNEDGKEVYSLTINSVEEFAVSEEDQEFIPTDSKQTVIITYTYKYINEEPGIDTLRITPSDDLGVYDATGLSADFIDLGTGYFPFDSDTPDILPGRSAKTYKVFSLKNESDSIQIDSGSANFGMVSFDGVITFELPVEKP